MTKEEAIKYLEKRKEKALMLMEKSKADTPINNKVRGTLTRRIEVLDMAISALSADVRPNIHGHWKVGFGNTWCSCSECSGNGSTNWSYCPWCGADMRGDKAE